MASEIFAELMKTTFLTCNIFFWESSYVSLQQKVTGRKPDR